MSAGVCSTAEPADSVEYDRCTPRPARSTRLIRPICSYFLTLGVFSEDKRAIGSWAASRCAPATYHRVTTTRATFSRLARSFIPCVRSFTARSPDCSGAHFWSRVFHSSDPADNWNSSERRAPREDGGQERRNKENCLSTHRLTEHGARAPW